MAKGRPRIYPEGIVRVELRIPLEDLQAIDKARAGQISRNVAFVLAARYTAGRKYCSDKHWFIKRSDCRLCKKYPCNYPS